MLGARRVLGRGTACCVASPGPGGVRVPSWDRWRAGRIGSVGVSWVALGWCSEVYASMFSWAN